MSKMVYTSGRRETKIRTLGYGREWSILGSGFKHLYLLWGACSKSSADGLPLSAMQWLTQESTHLCKQPKLEA
eukprot:510019-Amphidinium_carterae.1